MLAILHGSSTCPPYVWISICYDFPKLAQQPLDVLINRYPQNNDVPLIFHLSSTRPITAH